MTELLFAEESSSFSCVNGLSVNRPDPLSPIKIKADGKVAPLFSYLDSHRERRALSDTLISPPDGFKIKEYTVYKADSLVSPSKFSGRMIPARDEPISDLIRLIFEESAGTELPPDILNAVSKRKEENSYLWQDNGICAMASVAFKGKRYARINTVVTAKEKRGMGYAPMLVYTLSFSLINEGFTVTVLADIDNPISNGMYAKLGFIPCGKIYEYIPEHPAVTETAITLSHLEKRHGKND